MKLTLIVCVFLWMVPFGAYSQSNEHFYNEMSQAWRSGNSQSLSNLFDETVQLSENGAEESYNKDQLQSVLGRFFQANKPVDFNLKHSGSSNDGQLYMIGTLETRDGRSFKVVCRAKSFNRSYRIFQLDLADSY